MISLFCIIDILIAVPKNFGKLNETLRIFIFSKTVLSKMWEDKLKIRMCWEKLINLFETENGNFISLFIRQFFVKFYEKE